MYVYLSGCLPFSVVYSLVPNLFSPQCLFSFLNDSISLSHLSLVRLSYFFYSFLLISQYFHASFSSSITVFASLFFPYHLNHLLLLSVYSPFSLLLCINVCFLHLFSFIRFSFFIFFPHLCLSLPQSLFLTQNCQRPFIYCDSLGQPLLQL